METVSEGVPDVWSSLALTLVLKTTRPLLDFDSSSPRVTDACVHVRRNPLTESDFKTERIYK